MAVAGVRDANGVQVSIVFGEGPTQDWGRVGGAVSTADTGSSPQSQLPQQPHARRKRSAIDIAIAERASKQLGLVTALQLAGQGIVSAHLEQRARQGELHREARGVYRVPSHRPSMLQFILSRCFAIPGSVIGGIAAAAVHALPLRSLAFRKGRGPQLVELHVGPKQVSELSDARLRRLKQLGASELWHEGLVTTVPETLLDLARSVDREALGRCLDYSLSEGLVTVSSLNSLLAQRPRAIERKKLLDLLAERPTGTVRYRSALEQQVGRWLDDEHLGPVSSNFTVSGIGVEVDFAWISKRVALEVSPFYTHSSKEKQARDMQRRLLLQSAGWLIVECTDQHLVSAAAFAPIAAHIRTLLAAREL